MQQLNLRSVLMCMITITLMSACGKKDTAAPLPSNAQSISVSTDPVTAITAVSAIGGGSAYAASNVSIVVKGICWSKTNQTPTTADNTVQSNTPGSGSFSLTMSNLTPNTVYYARAFAVSAGATTYGTTTSFKTSVVINPPTVTTGAVTVDNDSTATIQGVVTSDGNAPVITYGVCYSATKQVPTIADKTESKSGANPGSFSITLKGLWAGTKYYARSFFANSTSTEYGAIVTFTTPTVFTIGQTYNGGKIFYLDQSNRHGLIVSTVDLNNLNGLAWGPAGSANTNAPQTGATGVIFGFGQLNTNAIIAKYGAGTYAAKVCTDYRGGGFSDWFLPSKNELNLIYINRSALGIPSLYYWWSSTEFEFSVQTAYSQNFVDGAASIDPKTALRAVRAVRAF
jgi:hypothetical protein